MIRSRRLARGKLAGAYAAAVRGAGLVFADVRPYEPGDDIRRFDWNVTARTGIPHVKQYIAERERIVYLLVDISGSMDFGLSGNKRTIAGEVAALIAYAAAANRDRVGLTLYTDRVECRLPPQRGDHPAHRLVHAVFATAPMGRSTNLGVALGTLRRARRGVVFLISDFAEGTADPGLRIAAKQHDLIAVRVSDRAETQLPNVGRVRLTDAEAGGALVINTSDPAARSAYAAIFRERKATCLRNLRAAGADVIEVTTAGGHLDALVRYFQAREQRR